MNVAIRVDASTTIGTGHLMRCLTLAAALKNDGAQIRFVCLHIPAHLKTKVLDAGFELKLISADPAAGGEEYSAWLGSTQSFDGRMTLDALADKSWDCVIVDQYALDYRWERMVHSATRFIFAIDDLADRRHECEMLMDQNFYLDMEERYRGKVSETCRMLLGTEFALLRNEFLTLSRAAVPRSGGIRNVLVFFGGIDAMNFTSEAIQALADIGCDGVDVNVVIGIQHPHVEDISALCVQHGFSCHIQTEKMADLMAAADLALGAGGSACWECCAVGTPVLVVITAENQRQLARELSIYGAAELVGDYQRFSPREMRDAIAAALDDPDKNHERSQKALALFPRGANGAQRVSTTIAEYLCAN